jgi:hypothetical protein
MKKKGVSQIYGPSYSEPSMSRNDLLEAIPAGSGQGFYRSVGDAMMLHVYGARPQKRLNTSQSFSKLR